MVPVDLIENSRVAAILTDPLMADNPIVACNDAFCQLTGYAREDILGRNCRFLRGTGTEPERTQQLREAIGRHQPALVEITNYRKDGSPFVNAVMVAPIFDDGGKIRWYMGSQMEVAAKAADATAERARGLIAGLTPRQREILKAMASGQLNKQIAYALSVSERTVKMHRAALFQALGVRTSAEAIRIAVEAGL